MRPIFLQKKALIWELGGCFSGTLIFAPCPNDGCFTFAIRLRGGILGSRPAGSSAAQTPAARYFRFPTPRKYASQSMLLDFEQPIAALEGKLLEMQKLAADSDVEVGEAVAALEKRIKDLKKETYANLTRWQRVQLSRHPERPYTLDYIEGMAEKFVELHGDRTVGDDKAMVGGFGEIDGQTVMFIGQQKGHNTKQRQFRNFGMPNPEGYRKALRLMKLAEKFNVPVVTLIDTPGAFPGLEAEERGQGEAIARNLKEMFMLKVPVVCVIIGEGASGGALGIAIGDRVLMLENTWYSVISPESCSSILWRSWDYKEQARRGAQAYGHGYEIGRIG